MNRPRVYLRLRPPISDEESNSLSHGEISDQLQTEFSFQKISERTGSRKVISVMRFDQIFPEETSQTDVYQNMTRDIYPQLCSGHTIGLIMYGTTGSGKTYSMEGTLGDQLQQGLLPRIMEESIKKISEVSSTYRLSISCLQIYNDKVENMLGTKQEKILKSSEVMSRLSVSVPGNSFVNLMKLYRKAAEKRHVAANNVHQNSSRSHAITQLSFNWTPLDNEKVENISKIIFVDLAGSEENIEISGNDSNSEASQRATLTTQEGKCIRRGLLHLKNVIRDIVSSKKKNGKRIVLNCGNNLTQVLDPLLNGESMIYVLLCLSNKVNSAIENTKTLVVGLDIIQLPLVPKKNKIRQEIALIDTIADQQTHIADLKHELEKAREAATKAEFLDENEKLNQISQKAEINELKSTLNELRSELMTRDQEIRFLSEMNCDLEIAKGKLITLMKAGVTEKNRNEINELKTKIEEKQNLIHELNSVEEELSMKLQSVIAKQNQQNVLLQNLQTLENINPQTEEIKGNIIANKRSLNQNHLNIDKLNHEIKKIIQRKQELESEVNNLKYRVDAHVLAQESYSSAIDNLQKLELEMKDLVTAMQGIPHSIPPSSQEIQFREVKEQLEQEISFAKQNVNQNFEQLSSTKLNLEVVLNALPEEKRIKANEAIQIYESQKEMRQQLLHQVEDLTTELDDLDDNSGEYSDGEDELIHSKNLNSGQIQNLKDDLLRLKEIEYNDELKILISQLPYNIDKLSGFLTFHPSCKERFYELGGVNVVVKYFELVTHASTFAKLCGLLENCLYDDPRIYEIIKSSTAIQQIEKWCGKGDWIHLSQGTHCLTLGAVSGLATSKYFHNELSSCQPIIRSVCHFILSSEIQSVLQAACRCLALLCPDLSVFEQICQQTPYPLSQYLSDLCLRLIKQLENPSAPCRREAAYCISKLFSHLYFREIFERQQVLKFALDAIIKQQTSNDRTPLQALSVLLLTLLEANNSSFEANPVVRKLAYESLAIGFANRIASDDVEAIQVIGVSPELPYTAEIVRGEWSCSNNVKNTNGGPVKHGLFFDNPMYALTIPKGNGSSSNELFVSFALKKMPGKHPSENDSEIQETRRTSYANVRIAPLSKFLEDVIANVRDEDTIRSLVAKAIQDGKIPINSMCFSNSFDTIYSTENVGTFTLERGETYLIVPHSEVRGIHEHFVLAIVGDAKFSLKLLSDNLQKQVFNGMFPLPDPMTHQYHGFESPSWRSFPQVIVEPYITKPELLVVMVSYRDVDDALDEIYRQHDEILSTNQFYETYSKRPMFKLKCYDVTDMEKRVVSSPYGNVESSSYWLSSSWSLLYVPMMPNKKYALCLGLEGGEELRDERLSYRLQLFHTPALESLTCRPLTRDHEWYSVSDFYHLSWSTLPLVVSISASSSSAVSFATLNPAAAEESNESKSPKSLLLTFRLLASKEGRHLKICVSRNRQFQPHTYYRYTHGELHRENSFSVDDWLTGDNPGQVYLSIEYLPSGSLPERDVDDDIFSLNAFGLLPLTVTTMSEENEVLPFPQQDGPSDDDKEKIMRKKMFLASSRLGYPSPINWTSSCWVEPSSSSSHKQLSVEVKKKVMVDLSFLQELYSQINKYIVTGSLQHHNNAHANGNAVLHRDWEVTTLEKLSQHLDSAQLERFTSKIKKLSAKDIRDIFLEISSATTFGQNLFNPEEIGGCCGSKGGGSREGRIHFMTKLIRYLETILRNSIDPKIEPTDLSAGSRPEDSARLLRKLCDAISTPPSSWRAGVEMINAPATGAAGSPSRAARILSPR
jgi:kinesin family member 5